MCVYPNYRGSSAPLRPISAKEKAEVTNQLPSTFADIFHAVDRLHVDGVTHASIRHPDCAKKMGPLSHRSLFEGAVGIGTEDAGLWSGCEKLRGKERRSCGRERVSKS